MIKLIISRISVPLIAVVALFGMMMALRYLGTVDIQWSNLAPVSAMALCFGFFCSRPLLAAALAFGGLILSDGFIWILAAREGSASSLTEFMLSPVVLFRYGIYAAIFMLACIWGSRKRTGSRAFLVAPGASLGFYLVMNTFSWATSVAPFAYAKTFAGWWQSQTVGLPIPGAPPSYLFLRNALIGDMLFTSLFVLLLVWLPNSRKAGNDSPLKLSEKAV